MSRARRSRSDWQVEVQTRFWSTIGSSERRRGYEITTPSIESRRCQRRQGSTGWQAQGDDLRTRSPIVTLIEKAEKTSSFHMIGSDDSDTVRRIEKAKKTSRLHGIRGTGRRRASEISRSWSLSGRCIKRLESPGSVLQSDDVCTIPSNCWICSVRSIVRCSKVESESPLTERTVRSQVSMRQSRLRCVSVSVLEQAIVNLSPRHHPTRMGMSRLQRVLALTQHLHHEWCSLEQSFSSDALRQ